jgi:hypothetical protein
MVQNRNKIIGHLAGNLTTAVVHKVLEDAASDENLKKYYASEASNSIEKARGYRKRINPVDEPLPEKDAVEIRERVIRGTAAGVAEKMLIELKIVIS